MKKRILQLTGSFHNGGSERQASALAIRLMSEEKYDIRLATLNRNGVLLSDVDAAGFREIREFPLTSFFNVNFVEQVRRCAVFLRDEKIDLVHTHDFYTNVFGMAAASLARTKAKITSKRETGGMRTRAQNFIERVAFRRADKIIANSVAVRNALAEQLIDTGKIEVIYNGLDSDKFALVSDRSTDGPRTITLVANLRHDVKNVPMFLRAAKIVSKSVADVEFVIAGEGELKQRMERFAQELDIADKVRFLDRCDDVPSLLSASYACALTSRAEGFSNSILEYMAAEKPVVATNVGGAAEAIRDGETGYLVDSDDAEAMASRLIELLNDPEKAERFGVTGRKIAVAKFSLDAQIEQTKTLYDSLLA